VGSYFPGLLSILGQPANSDLVKHRH